MATSLAHDAKVDEWTDPHATPAPGARAARADWMWPAVGLALLGAFLAFIVDDYPLRTIIVGN